MNFKRYALSTLVIWILLGAFMTLLRPDRLPVVILIVPFVLLYAALYSLWVLVRRLYAHYFTPKTLSKRLGLGVCAGVVLLLVLQSLGQLSLRDVVTVSAIIVLGYVYTNRVSTRLPDR